LVSLSAMRAARSDCHLKHSACACAGVRADTAWLGQAILVLAVLSIVGVAGETMGEQRGGADRLKGWISLRFPGIEWVTRDELSRWMQEQSGPRLILLDTRSVEEFAVSHLLDAVQVDPDIESTGLAHLARDARIVVYCSVGYRSGAVARRLSRAGFASVYNLEGGIFEWANQGGTVYRDGKPVDRVHPYDNTWGRLLDEKYRLEE
jgi:rhodanese-related sulfurtransferase